MIYAARYDTMNGLISYLTDNCCAAHPNARRFPLANPRARTTTSYQFERSIFR